MKSMTRTIRAFPVLLSAVIGLALGNWLYGDVALINHICPLPSIGCKDVRCTDSFSCGDATTWCDTTDIQKTFRTCIPQTGSSCQNDEVRYGYVGCASTCQNEMQFPCTCTWYCCGNVPN